jgi:chloride channel 7
MKGSTHSNYVVVDPGDNNIIYGTIPRNALCILLQQREFGLPAAGNGANHRTLCNYLEVDHQKFVPMVQWQVIERAYPKFPTVQQLRISESDRGYLVDLRPYCNKAAVTIPEAASVEVSLHSNRCSTCAFPRTAFAIPLTQPSPPTLANLQCVSKPGPPLSTRRQ